MSNMNLELTDYQQLVVRLSLSDFIDDGSEKMSESQEVALDIYKKMIAHVMNGERS